MPDDRAVLCPGGMYQQSQRTNGGGFLLPQMPRITTEDKGAGTMLEGYSKECITLRLNGKSIVLCSALHSIRIQHGGTLQKSGKGAKGSGVSLSLSRLYCAT